MSILNSIAAQCIDKFRYMSSPNISFVVSTKYITHIPCITCCATTHMHSFIHSFFFYLYYVCIIKRWNVLYVYYTYIRKYKNTHLYSLNLLLVHFDWGFLSQSRLY